MPLNILIVCRSFYPVKSARSLRATELALELKQKGHEVTVLTPFRDGQEEWQRQHAIQLVDLGQQKWSEIELKGGRIQMLFRKILKRLASMLFDYPSVELVFKINRALAKQKGYEVLISIAVPYAIHWGVASRWSTKKPNENPAKIWIADCGDPYYGRQNDSFRILPHFAIVEKWFMRKADVISIPIEGARNRYFTEFHEKIQVIPHGFRFPERTQLPTKKDTDITCPYFIYSGDMGTVLHQSRALFKALRAIPDDFRFRIYTQNIDFVKQEANDLIQAGKIELFTYIDRMELLEELAKVDFLVAFKPKHLSQVPSKLIDYSYIGKPILYFGIDGNVRDIYHFISGDYSEQLNKLDIEPFKIHNVVNQFLKVFDETIKK